MKPYSLTRRLVVTVLLVELLLAAAATGQAYVYGAGVDGQPATISLAGLAVTALCRMLKMSTTM